MDVNATGRLHRVAGISPIRSGTTPPRTASFGAVEPNCPPSVSVLDSQLDRSNENRGNSASASAGVSGPDSEWRSLERLCLRAEREGPQAWAQLLPHLQRRVDKFPRELQAWTYFARAQAALGNESEALRASQEAVRLDPTAPLGYSLSLLNAKGCTKLEQWSAAVRHCEAALASAPGDVEALELLVGALAAQEQWEKAESALEVFGKLSPERACRLAKKMASQDLLSPHERFRLLRKATGWTKGAEQPCKELGEICLVLQRNQEALQWFQKAFSQPGGASDVQVAHTLAQLHMRVGNNNDALDVYRIALCASPDSLPLHRSYSQLLLKEGRATDAIDIIRRGAKLAPVQDAVAMYISMAELQQGMGLNRDALRTWQAAAAMDESNVAAWRGLAAMACAAGDDEEQVRALQKLTRLEPHNQDLRRRLSAIQSGGSAGSHCKSSGEAEEANFKSSSSSTSTYLAKAKHSEGKEALELYERAARENPSCIEALEGAANARWGLGERELAASWYRALLALKPGDPTALCRVGIAALHAQNVCEAHAFLSRAVKCEHDSQDPLAWFGYAQLLLGHTDQAVESLQAALRLPADTAATRLYWALTLVDCGDDGAALEQFNNLVKQGHPRLRRFLSENQDASVESRIDMVGLSEDLPGKCPRICRNLEMLARRHLGKPRVSRSQTPPPEEVLKNYPQAPEPAHESLPEGTWRNVMREGQAVEVYSKSAGRWMPGAVTQLTSDMVKIKYLVDGHWCEKVLMRTSDSLRIMQSTSDTDKESLFAAKSIPQSRQDPEPQPGAIHPELGTKPGPAPQLGNPTASPYVSKRSTSPQRAAQKRAEPAHAHKADRSSVSPVRTPRTSPARYAAVQAPSSSPVRSQTNCGTAEAPSQAERRQWVNPPPTKPVVAAGGYPSSSSPHPAPHHGNAERRRNASGTPPPQVERQTSGRQLGQHAPQARRPTPTRSHPMEQLLNTKELTFGESLGSGGFGAVYRGTYRGEECAIKKLYALDGQITQMQIDEFKKEVANLQALQHPRLVGFIGAAVVSPSLCIVTEFMPNGSLYDLLHTQRKQLTFSQRLGIVIQITEGVEFLHSKVPPFVHRDLKSMNCVLDFSLNVKLCDFGLTQSMEKTHISRRDNEGGSPRYMAPELFDASGKITEKVDIWALGCLTMEVLTSKLPHEECNNIQQVMTKTLVQRKVPFTDLKCVGEDIRCLVELCFEFPPKKRLDAVRFLEGLRGLRP